MPEFFASPLTVGVLGRAIERDLMNVRVQDLRAYAADARGTLDDYPYGGGPGMVLKPEPLSRAIAAYRARSRGPLFELAPFGRRLDRGLALELAALPAFGLLCNRYEDMDARIRSRLDGAISIGDVVLSGGDPAALCVIDGVARFLPGVLGNEDSAGGDSFEEGLLDSEHWTRPPDFEGAIVPEVLLSGDHARVDRFRRFRKLRRTLAHRPDLVHDLVLTKADHKLIREFAGPAPATDDIV